MGARAGHTFAQILTLSRLALAVTFAVLAFQAPTTVNATIFAMAALTDLADGAIARRYGVQSAMGSTLDLISDKSLTVVSCLYAAARGVAIAPVALIAVRDVILLGLRIVTRDGQPLLSTSRIFGGVAATAMWGTTFLLVISPSNRYLPDFNIAFWALSILLTANLGWRILLASRSQHVGKSRRDDL